MSFEENVDDDLQADGFDECILMLEPFLNDKDQLESFKVKMKSLGIKNLSHISYLEHADVSDFISVISFRQMIKKWKEGQEQSEANKENYDKGGHVVNLETLISTDFFGKLKRDEEILTRQEWTKLKQAVADDIRINYNIISERLVYREALKIVKAYPTSMGCVMLDDNDICDAAGSFRNGILSHIRYIQQKNRETQMHLLGKNPSERRRKSDNFTKAQCYGLDPDRDVPSELPLGETNASQEEKRKALITINDSGETVPADRVLNMMKQTYVSQRIDINKKMSIESLLQRWPFIGMFQVLQSHFEYLMMDIDLTQLLTSFKLKFESMERFFEMESNTKRSGKDVKATSQELKRTVTTIRNMGSTATSSNKFIAMVVGAMISMKVPVSELFILFEETTSFDEVQASPLLPQDGRPIVAVLGSCPISNSRAYVVIENRVISEKQVSVKRGILAVMMSYFTFKIEYPDTAAPILYFLQSKVFRISGEGHRIKRRKLPNGKYSSAPPSKPRRYLKFMQQYKEYCMTWSLDVIDK